MFVAINNVEMNIFQLDEWIKRTRDANDGIISPDFALMVLSKTNHRGHIKTVVKNIKDRCKMAEEIEPYKNFILSCVAGRKMSEQAVASLREMASVGGFVEEFDKINAKPKFYEEMDCTGVIVNSKRDLVKAVKENGNLKIYFYADDIQLDWMDLSDLKFRCKDNAKVSLEDSTLPKNLDVSMCSYINLNSCDLSGIRELKFREGAFVGMSRAMNLPKDLDVSMCSCIDLSDCDLSGIRELKFRDGAEVILSKATNLPKDLDVSMCSRVDLSDCDLSGIRELKFREGAEVILSKATNLPSDLDFSMCSKVNLSGCDLGNVSDLKFREGAEVILSKATNLPSGLDVSMCSKIGLNYCDLSKFTNLKFREGAFVGMSRAMNLPEKLDVSTCSRIIWERGVLSGVCELKFRDKKQKDEFLEDVGDFDGKIIYAEDEGKSKAMPVTMGGGMEM